MKAQMNLKNIGYLLLPILFCACNAEQEKSATAGISTGCPPSSIPGNALEANVLKQTQAKAGCSLPDTVCTFTFRPGKDARLIVDVASQQLDENKVCFMAGDAVSSYLFDAKGNFIRAAYGGLSVEVVPDEVIQATDAGL